MKTKYADLGIDTRGAKAGDWFTKDLVTGTNLVVLNINQRRKKRFLLLLMR